MIRYLWLQTSGGIWHLSAREESVILVPLCEAPLPADTVEAVTASKPEGARVCRSCRRERDGAGVEAGRERRVG